MIGAGDLQRLHEARDARGRMHVTTFAGLKRMDDTGWAAEPLGVGQSGCDNAFSLAATQDGRVFAGGGAAAICCHASRSGTSSLWTSSRAGVLLTTMMSGAAFAKPAT